MTEARDHFALLFEMIPDAVLITRMADGICRSVNQGFEVLSGYGREEILDRSIVALHAYGDVGDRDRIVATLRARGSVDGVEIPFRRKDGRLFIGSVSARVVQLRGEPHVISVTRDVSDRKRSDEELSATRPRSAS